MCAAKCQPWVMFNFLCGNFCLRLFYDHQNTVRGRGGHLGRRGEQGRDRRGGQGPGHGGPLVPQGRRTSGCLVSSGPPWGLARAQHAGDGCFQQILTGLQQQARRLARPPNPPGRGGQGISGWGRGVGLGWACGGGFLGEGPGLGLEGGSPAWHSHLCSVAPGQGPCPPPRVCLDPGPAQGQVPFHPPVCRGPFPGSKHHTLSGTPGPARLRSDWHSLR